MFALRGWLTFPLELDIKLMELVKVDVKPVETFGFRQLQCLLDPPDVYRQTLVEITAAEDRSGFVRILQEISNGGLARTIAAELGQ